MSQYKRVILKLSGEALGENGKGFCHEKFERAAKVLLRVQQMGVQLAVVIGGGNVWRGRRGPSLSMGAVAADQMGMLGTLQNCLYMRDTLARLGGRASVMSAVDILRFAESYNVPVAIERLESGHILLLACGIGNPFFTTDTTVTLRGLELECDAVLIAKNNTDGVYTADPNTDPGAVFIPDISYGEALEQDLKVMDKSAFLMMKENQMPMLRIFGEEPQENIIKVLEGEKIGSTLHP